MIIPVRCFSCGTPVSAYYQEYQERLKQGETPAEIFDKLNITRYCCKRMLLTQVELIDKVARFKRA